ncbi:MAG: GTP 3',8-cyclase MoaA [Pseudomonadota bacterium]
MSQKFFPLVDRRDAYVQPDALPGRLLPAASPAPIGHLADALGRPLQDLRISVTDRCNFRCTYCMPREVFDKNHAFLPQSALLSFEEIARVAKLFVAHGVRKIRLTGGEPLLRKRLDKLVAMLAGLTTPDGTPLDLALTTNGALLAAQARALKDAGLRRITVSLDAINDAIFQRMNDVKFPVAEVLRGLDMAHQVGLGPIKINMVVKAGVNDSEIESMARYFKNSPFILRFIEYMDVGASNRWKMDEVVASSEIVRRIGALAPVESVAAAYAGETAQRWRYLDGSGEFGVISSVSQAFCADCSRARLSTEGKLYTCLFATHGHDLRTLLRTSQDDVQLSPAIARIWQARSDQYSALRALADNALSPTSPTAHAAKKVEMSYIGG